MTIDCVGDGGVATGASGASATAPLPDNFTTDDFALLVVQQTSNNVGLTTPTGWTLLVRTQRTTTHVQTVYYRKLVAGDGNPVVVQASGTGDITAIVSAWRGVDPVNPFDFSVAVSGTAASGLSFGNTFATAVTNTYANDRHISLVSGATSARTLLYDAYRDSIFPPTNDRAASRTYSAYEGFDYVKLGGSHAAAFVDEPNVNYNTQIDYAFDTASTIGYVATDVWLRAVDQTSMPQVSSLRGLMSQPMNRACGVLATVNGLASGNPKVAVLVADPFPPVAGYSAPICDTVKCDQVKPSGAYRWVDVSARVRGVSWGNGAEAPGDKPRVAGLSLTLDNVDGDASPWASSGDFVEAPRTSSWLRAGMLVRVAATFDDVVPSELSALGCQVYEPLFTGSVESIEEGTEQDVDAWVDITVVDTAAAAASPERGAVPEVGGGDTDYQRLHRILDSFTWRYGSDADRARATYTYQATTLEGSPLTEAQLLADSSDQIVFAGADGLLTLRPRGNDTFAAGHLLFSNDPGGALDEVVASFTGIASLFKLAETSGTVAQEEVANHDGTFSGSPVHGVAGYNSALSPATQLGTSTTPNAKVAVPSSAFNPGSGSWSIVVLCRLRADIDPGVSSNYIYECAGPSLSGIMLRVDPASITGSVPKLIFRTDGFDPGSNGFTYPDDQAWHLVGITYNASTHDWKTYLDGVLQATTNYTPAHAFGVSTRSDIGGVSGTSAWRGDVSRTAFFSVALTGAQMTALGDALAESELPMTNPVPYSSNERILNVVTAGRKQASFETEAPPVMAVSDPESIGQHDEIADGFGFPRDDLIVLLDAFVADLITRTLERTANDEVGIESLELDADMDPVNMFGVLVFLASHGLADGIVSRIRWVHPSGHVFRFLAEYEGMTHNVTMEGHQMKWTATLNVGRGA